MNIINKEESIKINIFDHKKNDEKIWLEFKNLHLKVSKEKQEVMKVGKNNLKIYAIKSHFFSI